MTDSSNDSSERGTAHASAAAGAPRRGGCLRRLVLGPLLAVAVVLVLLVVGGVLFLDSIVKTGISTVGSHVLGVRTAAADVSIGLVSGQSAIGTIEVDNPQGYRGAKFLVLGAVEVDAPLASLTGERIVIDRLALSDLRISLEKDADGTLNVQKIVDHMKAVTGSGDGQQQPPPSPDEPAAEAKEVLVKELRLERITVVLVDIAGGKDGVVEVAMPDLVLRDLSSKGGVDVLASELSGVVIGSVMKSVIAANIEGLGAEVVGHMKGALEGVGGLLDGPLRNAVDAGVAGAADALKAVGKGLHEGAGKVLEGAGSVIKGGAESVGKGVGEALDGLFGGGGKK
jgi:hypothetical protein